MNDLKPMMIPFPTHSKSPWTIINFDLKKRFEHIELPAKLLDCFLRSNKSNIDQMAKRHSGFSKVKTCYVTWRSSRTFRIQIRIFFCSQPNSSPPLSSEQNLSCKTTTTLAFTPKELLLHPYFTRTLWMHELWRFNQQRRTGHICS